MSKLPAPFGTITLLPSTCSPNNPLIPFTSAPTEFFPIHSGTATLSVTFTPPGASSQTSVDVPVQVNSAMPFTLGQAPSTFDTLIVGFADLRGIPPQILKGLIEPGTGFKGVYSAEFAGPGGPYGGTQKIIRQLVELL